MSLIVHSSSHGAMFASVLKTALLPLGCVSYCWAAPRVLLFLRLSHQRAQTPVLLGSLATHSFFRAQELLWGRAQGQHEAPWGRTEQLLLLFPLGTKRWPGDAGGGNGPVLPCQRAARSLLRLCMGAEAIPRLVWAERGTSHYVWMQNVKNKHHSLLLSSQSPAGDSLRQRRNPLASEVLESVWIPT